MKTSKRRSMADVARHTNRRWAVASVVAVFLSTAHAGRAAELSVGTLLMRANSENRVVVSGTIEDKSTIGVTIRVEIRPRSGNVGTVEFTPVDAGTAYQRGAIVVHQKEGQASEVRVTSAPAVQIDVAQVGDPWPQQGTFSPFDTDRTNVPTLNGSVDDNGTFLPAPVTYDGALSSFPVRASAGAHGVWDVRLATSHGDSSWEGVDTTLHHATITVSPKACASSADCQDGDTCTQDRCEAGVCVHDVTDDSCADHPKRKRRGPSRRP